jgi:hypothetical protein
MSSESSILNGLDRLPWDVRQYIIYPLIPPETKVWLTRSAYLENHKVVKNMIPTRDYESYIRDMVRDDCVFVMERLLEENMDKWSKMTKYRYKGMTFDNYLRFLVQLALDSGSTRVKQLIEAKADESLGRKWHKRNITWSNRWMN